MKIKDFINELKIKTAQVYLSIKSNKTPWYAKAMAGITIAYALSPVDLIPDFIPLLGYLDDLVIIPFFVFLTRIMIPKELWNSFREEALTLWENGKPKKWYYAIPIVIIWLCIIGIIAYSITMHFVSK